MSLICVAAGVISWLCTYPLLPCTDEIAIQNYTSAYVYIYSTLSGKPFLHLEIAEWVMNQCIKTNEGGDDQHHTAITSESDAFCVTYEYEFVENFQDSEYTGPQLSEKERYNFMQDGRTLVD